MIIGRTLLQNFTELWQLLAGCADCLGEPDDLLAMGEQATDSQLGPWAAFPHMDWVQGRVFGRRGELHWRSYGACVRVVMLVDSEQKPGEENALLAKLQQWRVEVSLSSQYTRVDQDIYLWRGEYAAAHIRSYVDAQGVANFVRYCTATPTVTESQ